MSVCTRRRRAVDTLCGVLVAFVITVCLPQYARAVSASENYVLDSAVIGALGSVAATSSAYGTNNSGGRAYYLSSTTSSGADSNNSALHSASGHTVLAPHATGFVGVPEMPLPKVPPALITPRPVGLFQENTEVSNQDSGTSSVSGLGQDAVHTDAPHEEVVVPLQESLSEKFLQFVSGFFHNYRILAFLAAVVAFFAGTLLLVFLKKRHS